MKRFMYGYRISLVFIFLVFTGTVNLTAQDLLLGPATGTQDSKSVFANPAVLSFQNPQIALGMRGYHLGFFDESGIGYKQGYISVLTPRVYGSNFGAGLQIQYFDSPIFRKSHFGGTASYNLFHTLSVGLNASLYHMSFNQDNFVGFDFEDPVFDDGFSKYSLNAAAGVYYRPLDIVEIGAGARNLTSPNLSLVSDNVTEPLEYFGSVSVRHQLLKGTFELMNSRYGIQSRVHAELFSSRGYYVRTGTNMNFDSGYLEAQAHISNGFSANYQFELPLNELSGNSSGSHMVSLIYEFNRVPNVPDKRDIPPVVPDLSRDQLGVESSGNILISSRTDHLMYYEKLIVRQIDTNTISEQDLQSLSRYDLGDIGDDPKEDRKPYGESESPNAPIPQTVELTSSISDEYRGMLEFLASELETNELDDIKILAEQGSEMRAAGTRNYIRELSGESVGVEQFVLATENDSLRYRELVDPGSIEDDRIIGVEPEIAQIKTIPTDNISVREWELFITDAEDNRIHTIRGGSDIPEIIEWDWITDDGDIIEPGVYQYQLEWVDTNGNRTQSNTRSLYIQKVHRKITIDITKDINSILNDPDTIEIILKNKE